MQLLLDNIETLRLIKSWSSVQFDCLPFEEEVRLDTWCKNYTSTGRYHTCFYFVSTFDQTVVFYFEYEADAVMFRLSA